MRFPVALALEAELLVEAHRRLVPREDVQLELADAGAASPLDRRLEERCPDPLAARIGRDHQAEICDVRARRMLIARNREAADDRAVASLGDEHRGMRVAAQRFEVAPLVADAPPLAVRR